jgi:uncharacterized protein YceK
MIILEKLVKKQQLRAFLETLFNHTRRELMMKKNNLQRLGLGVALAITIGLSGCDTGMHHHQYMDPQMQTQHQTTMEKSHGAQKSYASKDAQQKATPGPKRSAAPQLPVISQ